jgi:hypothetical protein
MVTGKSLEEQIQAIVDSTTTKDDFRRVLALLVRDATQNVSEWENQTVERYLSAMLAWLDAADGYYKGHSIDIDTDLPNWRVFSDLLLAARVYE